MKKLFLIAAVLSTATLLTACGGGGGDAVQVAAVDARLEADADSGRPMFTALANESFTFTNGVAEFGTAGTATTVSIQEPAAAGRNPRFTISSGGETATGTMAYGSCFFRITVSTFAPPSPLVDGAVIEIDNCGVVLDTAGQHADGVAVESSAVLFLNNANSTGTTVTVAINPSGRITLNGRVVGTVTLRPITGVF
jgi:hypothetical protein